MSASLEKTVLPNGITVLSQSLADRRTLALGAWLRTGSRDEPHERLGITHFIEHMMFKGTATRDARAIAASLESLGGHLDAFTSREQVCYTARVLSEHLPQAVEVVSDIVCRSRFDPEDIEREKSVIREEILSYEDNPEAKVADQLSEQLWGDHALGRPILGTRQSIINATRDQVRRFYRKHYLPGNVVVVAAGNLRHEELLDLVAEHMDPGTVRAAGPSAWNLRPAGDVPGPSGRSLVKKRKTEQAHICIGTSGLSRTDPDRFAFGVVNNALGGGMSSRLFREIREKRGLAYSVYLYHSMYAEAGVFCAYAGTTPGRAKETLAIMRAELEDVANKGLGPDEFERAKGHMKGSLVLSLEDPGGRMSRLGKSEIGHGESLTVNQLLSRIEAVTPEDAERAAERVLSQPMTVTVLGPFSGKDAIA